MLTDYERRVIAQMELQFVRRGPQWLPAARSALGSVCVCAVVMAAAVLAGGIGVAALALAAVL